MEEQTFLDLIKRTKTLLEEGETEKTIAELLRHPELIGKTYEQEVILLSGQYQRWKRDFRLGLNPESTVENRIPFALAQIIDEVDSRHDLAQSERHLKRESFSLIYDSQLDKNAETWTRYSNKQYIKDYYNAPAQFFLNELYGLSFYLTARQNESVGFEKPVQCLKGYVELEYKALSTGVPEGGNLMVQCIPMKHNKPHQTGYIEVGSDVQDDPKNPFSFFRKRFIIPKEHIGDNQWHSVRIVFDFSDLPKAFYSIIAPRINESAENKGRGALEIRKVKIFG